MRPGLGYKCYPPRIFREKRLWLPAFYRQSKSWRRNKVEFNDSRSKKNDEYWLYLKENLREVSKWPTWMRGIDPSNSQECTSSPAKKEERPEEPHDDKPESE